MATKEDLICFINEELEQFPESDLQYYIEAMKPDKRNEFNTIIYNLVTILQDVYTRAPYYRYQNICPNLLKTMVTLVDELGKKINTSDSSNVNEDDEESKVNFYSQQYNEESREDIKIYYKKINDSNYGAALYNTIDTSNEELKDNISHGAQ